MTAKKRARNRNKKAAAAAAVAQAEDAENRPTTPKTTTTTATTAIVSPDNIIQEDTDICVHGLNLLYSDEDVKQTIKDLCDNAASDMGEVHRVIFGRGILDRALLQEANGCLDPFASVDIIMKDLFRLNDEDDISEDEVLAHYGITQILTYKFPEIDDYTCHKWMISHFVSEGTKCLLRGDVQTARGNACFANYFEQIFNLVEYEKMFSWPKLMRFLHADEHTLCSYFRNRIPCSCLDEKYKEVKSVVKLDMCWNAKCKKPNRFAIDRETMLTCSRCRQAVYCSSKCQEIDWRVKHKKDCTLHRDTAGVCVFYLENNSELKNKNRLAKYLPCLPCDGDELNRC